LFLALREHRGSASSMQAVPQQNCHSGTGLRMDSLNVTGTLSCSRVMPVLSTHSLLKVYKRPALLCIQECLSRQQHTMTGNKLGDVCIAQAHQTWRAGCLTAAGSYILQATLTERNRNARSTG